MISSPYKKKVKDGASCMVPESAELEFLIMISASANFICLKFEKVAVPNFLWLIYDETSDAPAVKLVKVQFSAMSNPCHRYGSNHRQNVCCCSWRYQLGSI
ncbi:hypothetical protein F2P56_002700 [Juglans regia]|uniref:Uncharacterized protein n=1 Tax=Juglans regia TaxID=51240 RepID=A0A833Y9J9_JUGRE|nr:hypothetical protein F2P56_002700 [Juglans regia]